MERLKERRLKERSWREWLATDNPSIEVQLRRWLLEPEVVNGEPETVQLQEDGIRAVLRNHTNHYVGPCLAICAVDIPPEIRHQGWFKSFLKVCCGVNPWKDVIIEDVENDHLRTFCQSQGFSVLHPFYATTYMVNIPEVMKMATRPTGFCQDWKSS